VYDYELSEAAEAQSLGLSYEATIIVSDVIAEACLDPWNFQRQADELDDDHHAHRAVPIGDVGMLTYLIIDREAMIYVTSITWLG
jgi:hypothetical protein